jgi:hypothetical protein
MREGQAPKKTGRRRPARSWVRGASLCAALLLALLPTSGCVLFPIEETATPTMSIPIPETPLPTATVVLPTPPPGATLTSMVETYRRTRTPFATRLRTPTPPPVTLTRSATPVGGVSIHVVPELLERGQLAELRGAGWEPGEKITIGIGRTVDGAETTDVVGTARPDGTFAATLKVPGTWTDDSVIVIAESADARRRAVTRLFLTGPTVAPTSRLEMTATPSHTPTARPSPTPLPTPSATATFAGWHGAYYANTSLAGDPVLVRDDEAIDFDWDQATPAPGVPADNFSVRWTREVDFVPGTYEFEVRVDDGVRVYIDDELVLDKWQATSPTSYQFQYRVQDPVLMRVEYFDTGGNATIRLLWDYLGQYPDWRGAYYPNPSLEGNPAVVRNDEQIDFDWAASRPVPAVPPDNFSVRWTQTVTFDAGTYRFHARADDGIRAWINDSLIIDEWHLGTADTEYTSDVRLSRSTREVRVEYYDAAGTAEVVFWWEDLTAYPDWRGAYFDNRNLISPPAFVRNDTEINFNWHDGGPDSLGPDNFSVRWQDQRSIFDAGTYHFFVEHDDGARLWVDDRLVVDAWYETGPVTDEATVVLDVGTHDFRVEYFEGGGLARMHLWWEVQPIQ